MRRFLTSCVLSSAVLTASSIASANFFVNAGFEDPITFDGPPFVGSWEGFSGGTGAFVANSAAMPRSGAMHAELNITNSNNNFAGVFQDVPVVAGAPVVFSGYHKSAGTVLDVGIEFRIEWRDSVSNTEVGRTPNSTTAPTGDYTLFTLNANVPAGADTARAVYAIQSFGPEPTDTGIVFLDDMSFVPEPASLAAVFGAALLVCRRRR